MAGQWGCSGLFVRVPDRCERALLGPCREVGRAAGRRPAYGRRHHVAPAVWLTGAHRHRSTSEYGAQRSRVRVIRLVLPAVSSVTGESVAAQADTAQEHLFYRGQVGDLLGRVASHQEEVRPLSDGDRADAGPTDQETPPGRWSLPAGRRGATCPARPAGAFPDARTRRERHRAPLNRCPTNKRTPAVSSLRTLAAVSAATSVARRSISSENPGRSQRGSSSQGWSNQGPYICCSKSVAPCLARSWLADTRRAVVTKGHPRGREVRRLVVGEHPALRDMRQQGRTRGEHLHHIIGSRGMDERAHPPRGGLCNRPA